MSTTPLVLVCGSRHWLGRDRLRQRLDLLPRPVRIVHGGAHGADRMAAWWALERGVPAMAVLANWHKHGKLAGPLRNQTMLEMGPDLVLAFRVTGGPSPGTDHMVRIARDAGVPVEVIFDE